MKKITFFSASGFVLAIAFITIFVNVKTEPHVPIKREESQSVDVEITDTESISEAASEIEIETIKAETSTQTKADEEHEQTADTIITTEINTSASISSEEHGLIIGDYHEPETYNCGTPGHHCAGPETHALLTEMADKGCEYCGSHSCPSFYAVDEWGQGCYDPTKCPEYNVQHDPCYYCQDCGKPCGDGSNGTCTIYNIDITCPNCGEYVKAWTCHSCK